MDPTSPDGILSDLLLSLFSAEELRRFLRRGPDGERVDQALPGATASSAHLADEAAVVLRKRGLVTADLFVRLTKEVPGRANDIAAADRLLVSRDAIGALGASTGMVDALFEAAGQSQNRIAAERDFASVPA